MRAQAAAWLRRGSKDPTFCPSLLQVLQGDNRLVARTPAPVRFRRSVYHPDLSALLLQTGHGFSALRSPPWQASYGGIGPEGHVLFSPLLSVQHQLQTGGASTGSGHFALAAQPAAGGEQAKAAALPLGEGAAGLREAIATRVPELLELVPPAEWVRDEDAPACQAEDCDSAFGLFRRRHHCRACGGVFCASCSSHTLRLEQGPTRVTRRRAPPLARQHRVCDECFAAATLQ